MSKKINIGVMQGRLLPKYKGRYQAHPLNYWEPEFILAKERSLDCIEFILDYNDVESNPLMSEKGIMEIKEKVRNSNVKVLSVCADYFMESPFHQDNDYEISKSQNILKRLINSSEIIGIKNIIIPCVDHSSLHVKSFDKFIINIEELVKYAEEKSINICLETDLPPKEFKNLIDGFNNNNIKVNYDIGNSASLGYNVEEEFEFYGNYISDVHIKDRIFNGGSVELGTGDADIDALVIELKKIDYSGLIILQAYRDDQGINIFDKQYDFFVKKFKELI
jgi:L-ribulose-5-phosphate 3-epimerase